MKKVLLAMAALVLLLCSTVGCKSVQSAIAMKDCDYSFSRIGDISFMGIGKGMEPLSRVSVAKITLAATKLVTGVTSSVPLNFTLYLNVYNPNQRLAAVNHLVYKVTVDDVEFADGETESSFAVAGGETQELALPINVDLKEIVNKEHIGAVLRLALEMMGMGGKEKALMKVQIKPTVGIEKAVFTSPTFIPITIEYGGKSDDEEDN